MDKFAKVCYTTGPFLQGKNRLFIRDLTMLRPSNGIGVVACFILKKRSDFAKS
jgi:hypothetical protein